MIFKKVTGTSSDDAFFNNVSLLLHMNGTNGSTAFTDSSKNNFQLAAFGDAQISTAQKKYGDGSGYFDGNGDYVTVEDPNAFNFGNGDFTIECWFNPDNNPSPVGNLGTLISTATPIDIQGIYLGIFPNRTLHWLYSTGGSWEAPTQPTEAISASTWNHIAYVRSSGNLYLFVNGTQVASGSIGNGVISNSNNRIVVGGRTNDNQYYAGYIDELRITKGVARYTSNFTPPTASFPSREIKRSIFKKNGSNKIIFKKTVSIPSDYLAFWKLADLTDSSPNGNNLINTNNVQFVPGKIGNCAQFNQSNYLQNNSLTPTFNPNGPAGEFTISCWINPASFSNYQAFLGSTSNGFIIHTDAGGNLYCNEAGSGDAQINGILQLNQWQHIVFVKSVASGNRTKVWYNGTKVYDQPTNNNGNYQSKTNITLGNYGDLGFPYNGKLDMVGLWNRELTQSEIDLLYNNGNGIEP